MTDEYLIIANPTSGGGRGRTTAEKAGDTLKRNGKKVRIYYTEAAGDAGAETNRVLDEDRLCIIACGGDGTIHEIINSMAGTKLTLGILPCGRGNDFARALNIPSSVDRATDIILKDQTRQIDLGRVGDRYFATVVTLGFDSEVARLVYEKAVPFKGTAAYILGVIKMFRTYRGIHLKMSGDFGVIEQSVLLTATGNTPFYGGGMKIVPDAVPTDGLLDVCHAGMMSRLRILKLLPTVFWGGHTDHANITMLRTREVLLETDTPVVLFGDGEPICETPARLSVAPQALTVLYPKP